MLASGAYGSEEDGPDGCNGEGEVCVGHDNRSWLVIDKTYIC